MSLLSLSQYQLVSGAGNTGSPQVLQISQGQGGQRVAVPIKMLLQPQVDLLVRIGYYFLLEIVSHKCGKLASTSFSFNNSFCADKLGILSRWNSLCSQSNQHVDCRPLNYNYHSFPGYPHHQVPWRLSLCATRGDPVQAGESKPHCGRSYSSSQSPRREEPAPSPEPGWASKHAELSRNRGHVNCSVFG